MSNNKIRIATRKSPLALWQANYVKGLLEQYHDKLEVELVALHTQGDRILDTPLSSVGGKGLFIKELEEALFDGRADIAVHSMKDVTVDLPDGLALPVILEREDPRDVFISNQYNSIKELSGGTCIGTSSLRRQSQIRAANPELICHDLRGNVGTRLNKLEDGKIDAIILAAAGIKRLGMQDRINEYLDVEYLLPAIGQGAIGIEMRSDDKVTLGLIKQLNHESTRICVEAERAFGKRLFGGCQLPIAAYATIVNRNLTVHGLVGRVDGSKLVKDMVNGKPEQGSHLGQQLADKLLAQGAGEILQEVTNAR